MAKLQFDMNAESTKVKFECLQRGEVFVIGDMHFMKIRLKDNINAVRLDDGEWKHFNDDDLVTYVNKAEEELLPCPFCGGTHFGFTEENDYYMLLGK